MTLKLCDFGFARTLNGKPSDMTDYVATRWYRAPELLLSTRNYGMNVDQWAIGCIMGELIDKQPLFPGESEIDQIYIIQNVIGPLTPEQHELFTKNPRFLGYKFPDLSRPETLERKYAGKASKLAISFMKELLQMDSSKRPTAEEALNHPYFDTLKVGVLKNEIVKSKACLRGNNNLLSGILVPSSIHTKHSKGGYVKRQEVEKLVDNNMDRIRISTKFPKGDSDKAPSNNST